MSNTPTRTGLETDFTRLLGCQIPIIAGPMFLVSDEELTVAVSEAGAVGGFPSLNWRSTEEFRKAVRTIRSRTSKPFAVNLIVNDANVRWRADLDVCAEERVPMVITSLGKPKEVIEKMHAVGSKVFCDITTLEYALKVQDQGADGVIAVSAGAGGHAGPTALHVLVPYLHERLRIPIVAAGGISTGRQVAAALMLGASAVQIGTRFIASREAKVGEAYKKAIVDAKPEDIVLTRKVSGTPCSVIRTPYIDRVGTELNAIEAYLHKHPTTRRYARMLRAQMGTWLLEKAAALPTWKEVWSAGQGVGLIESVKPASEIVRELADGALAAFRECAKRV